MRKNHTEDFLIGRIDGQRKGRLYDKNRWRKVIRPQQLQREPHCRMCSQPATDVDHIVALRDGGSFDDPANLRSLCHSHHSSVTHAWQRGKPVPNKGVDAATGLPLGHHWWRK